MVHLSGNQRVKSVNRVNEIKTIVRNFFTNQQGKNLETSAQTTDAFMTIEPQFRNLKTSNTAAKARLKRQCKQMNPVQISIEDVTELKK